MLKYLIIQLDDSSTSFCHYSNYKRKRYLMPLATLKETIVWSMKENLTLQFIYPDYILPEDYKDEIRKTFHADIVSSKCKDEKLRTTADVVTFNSLKNVDSFAFNKEQSYVLRLSFEELFDNCNKLCSLLPMVNRVNIVITDILSLKKGEEKKYDEFLNSLSDKIVEEYKADHTVQINLLTDRIFLDSMNNCNAGYETLSLCPDGKLYVCPAFYSEKDRSFNVGNLKNGLDLKNPQLYRLNHAPICRICDAYQCRRCVWLNKKATLEVNTPSHEQCVASHLERNASRKLLFKIRKIGQFIPDKDIIEINYLDPFDKIHTI